MNDLSLCNPIFGFSVMAGKVLLLFILLVPWGIKSGVIRVAAAPATIIPLANPPSHRWISNQTDAIFGWGGYNVKNPSKFRAAIHAAYHEAQYWVTRNPAEHERAKDQWGVVTGGFRDNLKKYADKLAGTSS